MLYLVTGHVDGNIGSDDPECGSISTPCKSLSQGLFDANKRIIITGEIVIHKTFEIQKQETAIIGKGAIIKWMELDESNQSKNNQRFAFKVPENEFVEIRNIIFVDTGILLVERNPTVEVSNCTVSGNVEYVFKLDVAMGITMNIIDCKFMDFPGYVIFYNVAYQYETVAPNSTFKLLR